MGGRLPPVCPRSLFFWDPLIKSPSKTQAEAIVDSMRKSIMTAAENGEEISRPGFGKFKVKETPEREGRNPASGEKIKIAASRKLTYLPAKAVKELLNS